VTPEYSPSKWTARLDSICTDYYMTEPAIGTMQRGQIKFVKQLFMIGPTAEFRRKRSSWQNSPTRISVEGQGVLLVSESEIYEVLREFTKSARCLPSSDRPASQASSHDRVDKSEWQV
jgi:hypothetical protein